MGAYEIMEMFSHLSLDDKKEVIKDLQKMIEVQENEPAHSLLEENWIEIENLMYELSREPYIDDQLEIDEIWNLCEDMIKSGELKKMLADVGALVRPETPTTSTDATPKEEKK